MDPNEVQLTFFQKIRPFLRTANEMFPWQFIVIIGAALFLGVYVARLVPQLSFSLLTWTVKIVIGWFVAFSTWLILGSVYTLVGHVLSDVIKKFRYRYDFREYETKKKLLDNIIEDEILK